MNRTVTKAIELPLPADTAFDFLSSVENWPQWAVHNVTSATAVDANTWEITTPRGPGKIVLHADRRPGILDHEFHDAEGNAWTVPARIVPAGSGSVFMLTFAQPPGMPDAAFDKGMAEVGEELATLKAILSKR